MNPPRDSKSRALWKHGALHTRPERVHDPLFQHSDFFDPRDIVQVKYDMLRRVGVERASVTKVTEQYGVSRPTYYETKANFEGAGVAGLVPKKRGPRGPHKLQGEVLAFLEQHLSPDHPIRARTLATLIREQFDLTVHPRTIERGVRVKKTPR